MANKLSQDKIDAMWAAWQEQPSIRHVVRKCHVAKKTVERYRDKEKWDERRTAIEVKATRKADNALVKRRARQLSIVKAAVKSYAQQLIGSLVVECPHCKQQHSIPVPALKAKFSDIDQLVRLEEFLSGEADSREEHIIKVVYVEPPERN